MRPLYALTFLAAVACCAFSAEAFTLDDHSMSSESASARYSDPDEKTPVSGLSLHYSGPQQNGNNAQDTTSSTYTGAPSLGYGHTLWQHP